MKKVTVFNRVTRRSIEVDEKVALELSDAGLVDYKAEVKVPEVLKSKKEEEKIN